MSGIVMPGVVAMAARLVPWDPLKLSPELWLRPDAAALTLVSGDVSVLANQGTAGSALNFSQGTAGSRPTHDASDADFGGAPTISGDGSRFLSTSGTPTELDVGDGDDLTVIAVFRQSSDVSDYLFGTSTLSPTRLDLELRGTTASRWNWNGTNIAAAACGVATTVVGRWQRLGAAAPSNDTFDSRIADTGAGTLNADTAALNPGANGQDWHVLGPNRNSGPFTGTLGELIAVKRILTAGELASLTSYVNDRYGLAVGSV